MKQEEGMLCETAEQEEIDGAHTGGVCEIVPIRETDEMHDYFVEKPFCRLSTLFVACLCQNKMMSACFVI